MGAPDYYSPKSMPPNEPLRIVFWTTTLQADVLSLARALQDDPRFNILVVADDPESFRGEAIQQLLPLHCPIIDKRSFWVRLRVRHFSPTITIVDNHFPKHRLSPLLFVLWHGFGWKGPNDRVEFAEVHRSIQRLTGAASEAPNPRFRWQCFGMTDLLHRHEVSGFARENLLSLGAAFTDDLVQHSVSREVARSKLPQSLQGRRIALLAFTWHYGRVFSHWGDDLEILERISNHLSQRNAAVILRMHDRKRYEPAYLEALERWAERCPEVLIKYKDRDRDSLLDLAAADLMVSNYSSILNYFYATGRPSIHVYPVADGNERFLWRTWKNGKVQVEELPSAQYVWKLAPEENGGLVVRSLDELLAALDRGLDDPACCADTSRQFIDKHMAPVDGYTCKRIADALLEFAGKGG